MNKKGQLGWIEFKFYFYGLLTGIVVLYVLMSLAKHKILPFQIPVL